MLKLALLLGRIQLIQQVLISVRVRATVSFDPSRSISVRVVYNARLIAIESGGGDMRWLCSI